MNQVRHLIKRGSKLLSQAGIENYENEARWIVQETLANMDDTKELDELQTARVEALFKRREAREPLQYILGTQEFCGLTLQVNSSVLVPRPETTELVTMALDELADKETARVIDVGTGSGAIALALRRARPLWNVHATDISEEALQLAKLNATQLDLSIEWHCGSLLTHIATENAQFDLIAANLPYIGRNERRECDPELEYEPSLALYAEEEGLALIRQLLKDLDRTLASDGVAIFEHGHAQGSTITGLAAQAGLQCEISRDFGKRERFAVVRRTHPSTSI